MELFLHHMIADTHCSNKTRTLVGHSVDVGGIAESDTVLFTYCVQMGKTPDHGVFHGLYRSLIPCHRAGCQMGVYCYKNYSKVCNIFFLSLHIQMLTFCIINFFTYLSQCRLELVVYLTEFGKKPINYSLSHWLEQWCHYFIHFHVKLLHLAIY